MALEEATFKVGRVLFPLTASITNSLLLDADPTLYYALDFFAGVLQIHLGDRWFQEATRAGFVEEAATFVRNKVPYDPAYYLKQNQIKPPILALYPIREDIEDKSNLYSNTSAVWSLSYILPPLSVEQAEQLLPFLRAVPKVLLNRLRMGWDPNYALGQLPWLLSGGMSFEILSVQYGSYEGTKDLFFPATQIELRVSEQEADASNSTDPIHGIPDAYNPFTEIVVREDQKNVDGSIEPEIAQILYP